jgi:hypothetical protein
MVIDERATAEDLAAELADHRGQWVAIRDNQVIDAADTPAELIDRLGKRSETGWVLDHVQQDPNTVYIL